MQKLIRSIGGEARDEYVLQVHKCNRDTVFKTPDPYYERRYPTKNEALAAHQEVVRLLSSGKLPLKRIRADVD